MKFTPLSEEELKKQRGQLKPGDADFEIIEAIDEVSKQGNPMIKLQLRVWDSEGKEGVVFDYLTSNAQWKIRNLLEAIGRLDLYSVGDLDPDSLLGSSGSAVIFTQKDKTGQYGDSTKIKDYFLKEGQPKVKPDLDDIPF